MKRQGGPAWPSGIADGPLGFASYLGTHDPRLLADYVRWFAGARWGRSKPAPPSADVATLSPEEARASLKERLSAFVDGPALQQVRIAAPRATAIKSNLNSLAGDASLGELAYVLVRGLQPDLVIETGVAQGVTSAYLLAGLADNGRGELHSVDLPSREMIKRGLVGAAVPESLRGRWHYHWGSSRRLLVPLLKAFGPRVELFLHDSDHSYANMRWELERAWAAVSPGAWIVADDAELHAAFNDVADAVGSKPLYVSQLSKRGWTGLMPKLS